MVEIQIQSQQNIVADLMGHPVSSSLSAYLNVRALRDVGERQQLPPLLAPALAVVRPALLRLDVHRVRHDVLQFHELHLEGFLFLSSTQQYSLHSSPSIKLHIHGEVTHWQTLFTRVVSKHEFQDS